MQGGEFLLTTPTLLSGPKNAVNFLATVVVVQIKKNCWNENDPKIKHRNAWVIKFPFICWSLKVGQKFD